MVLFGMSRRHSLFGACTRSRRSPDVRESTPESDTTSTLPEVDALLRCEKEEDTTSSKSSQTWSWREHSESPDIEEYDENGCQISPIDSLILDDYFGELFDYLEESQEGSCYGGSHRASYAGSQNDSYCAYHRGSYAESQDESYGGSNWDSYTGSQESVEWVSKAEIKRI